MPTGYAHSNRYTRGQGDRGSDSQGAEGVFQGGLPVYIGTRADVEQHRRANPPTPPLLREGTPPRKKVACCLRYLQWICAVASAMQRPGVYRVWYRYPLGILRERES